MASLRSKVVRVVVRLWGVDRVPEGASIADQRKALERSTARVRPARGAQIEPTESGGVPAEWVSTPGAVSDRVVLYLHGGSYSQGSPLTHRGITTRLSAASGARVLAPNYRLGPEHRFPAAVEDATASYRWLVAGGIAPGHIALAGDSAGGGLALALALTLRDAGEPLPAAIACVSPWTDLAGTGASRRTRAKADPWLKPDGEASTARLYLGDVDPRTPLASPLYADLRGLPPLLIQVGTDEILLDDSTELAKRARAAGVAVRLDVWPGMWHVWHGFAGYIPEAGQAIRQIGAFVREHWA